MLRVECGEERERGPGLAAHSGLKLNENNSKESGRAKTVSTVQIEVAVVLSVVAVAVVNVTG